MSPASTSSTDRVCVGQFAGAPASDRVCVGQFAGAQGVRGLVRVKSFTADPADVAAYGPVEDERGERRFVLSIAGAAKGVVIVKVPGVDDRDAAAALAGTRLYVARDRLPPPDDDEFYHADLIGMAVEQADGTALGRVRAMHDFGAGDVLEVAGVDGHTVMLPFTRAVVPIVDMTARRLVVEPPAEVVARQEGDAA